MNHMLLHAQRLSNSKSSISQQHRQYGSSTSKVRFPPKLKSSTKPSPNTRIFHFHPQPTTTNKHHSLIQHMSTSNHSDSPFSIKLLLSIDILVVIDRSEQFLVHLLLRIHRTLQQLQLMNEMPAMFATRLGILHEFNNWSISRWCFCFIRSEAASRACFLSESPSCGR